MNNASINGCNIITLGDCLVRHTKDENEALKSTLAKLKKEHGTLNYCVLYQILNDSECDIFLVLESIQSLIDDINEPEISDELKKSRVSLNTCVRNIHSWRKISVLSSPVLRSIRRNTRIKIVLGG